MFGPQHAQGLYVPEAGYVSDAVAVPRDGTKVRAGQVLAVLVSPDLDYRLQAARAEEAQLRWQVEQQPFDPQLLQQGVALRKRWEAAHATVEGLERETGRLSLRAPFDGVVQIRGEGLPTGTWVPRGEQLFDLIGPEGIKGEAFVGEEDIGRVAVGDAARFVTAVAEDAALRCRVTAVDKVNLSTLDEPALASLYGGPVPAEKSPNTHQLVPLAATYRVRVEQCGERPSPAREIVGTATLGNARESYAWRALMRLAAVLEREAGS